MKMKIKDWLKVSILLLDEAAAVALILLVLRFFEINLPLVVIVVFGLVGGLILYFIHRAVIPSFHRKQVTGIEGLLGLEAITTKPLTPDGIIKVKNEYWQARSIDGNITPGETVEIVGANRLTLLVKHKKP